MTESASPYRYSDTLPERYVICVLVQDKHEPVVVNNTRILFTIKSVTDDTCRKCGVDLMGVFVVFIRHTFTAVGAVC